MEKEHGSTKTHQELRAELIGRAAADDGFRTRLTADPKAAVKEAPGVDLPESLTVHVHEETALSAHIVLPPMALLDVDDFEVAAGIAAERMKAKAEHIVSLPDDAFEVLKRRR